MTPPAEADGTDDAPGRKRARAASGGAPPRATPGVPAAPGAAPTVSVDPTDVSAADVAAPPVSTTGVSTGGEPTPLDAAAVDAEADALAAEVARRMYADDAAARSLGIEILETGAGHARLAMRVRPEMCNGHGIGHGGYTFLLADTAFAYACNSRNQRAVAASAAIDFLAPTHAGDVLTAVARERHLAGRNGVYDIEVRDPRGQLVAMFRGKSATIRGRFVEDDR